MYVKAAIGQDSHRFSGLPRIGEYISDAAKTLADGADYKPLLLGGVLFPEGPPLLGNSDADVVLHALCNAISGVTGVNILGAIADKMCIEEGITDSAAYVKEAMKHLGGGRIAHVSFSIECAKPAISPRIADMRENISNIIGVDKDCVCITATGGEGLTDFGRGLGIQALCILTAYINSPEIANEGVYE